MRVSWRIAPLISFPIPAKSIRFIYCNEVQSDILQILLSLTNRTGVHSMEACRAMVPIGPNRVVVNCHTECLGLTDCERGCTHRPSNSRIEGIRSQSVYD